MQQTDADSIALTGQGRLQEAIGLLLGEAKSIVEAYRAEQREPFCRPVTLTFSRGNLRRVTGFCKDISPTGIGLLHCMAVDPGEVVLTIPSVAAGILHVRSEILWCAPCRRGWYLSGARFLEIVPSAPS
jgi:hypothetical protein